MIPEWNRKCKSKLVWLQEEMNHLTLTKHFSCDCKCKLNLENVIQIKNRISVSSDVGAKIHKNMFP